MIRRRAVLGALAATPLMGLTGRACARAPTFLELAVEPMEPIADSLWIAQLSDSLWVYSGTSPLAGGHYPYNGMLVADGERSILVDTGWSPAHGRALLRWAEETPGKPVHTAIATHFHNDRTGGIAVMRRAGVRPVGHPMTTGLARALGEPEPDPLPELARGPVDIGPLELFYPGPGHSADNIAVYHRPSRTLYGGCLVKSTSATGMGNLQDAVPDAYDSSLTTLQERYRDRRRTIPGHGTMAGDAIAHSRRLLAEHLG